MTWNNQYCHLAKSKMEAVVKPLFAGASVSLLLGILFFIVFRSVYWLLTATPEEWDAAKPHLMLVCGLMGLWGICVFVLPWLWFHFCCAVGYVMYLMEKKHD